MKLDLIIRYLNRIFLIRELSEWQNPYKRWLVKQVRLLYYTWVGMTEHATMVRCAALTFYTLISLVPIAAVIFAVVKGFGLAEGMIDKLYGYFPSHPEAIDYIVKFAENALARTQGGLMASVALVMLFWAVITVFGSIESAFNNIWEVKVTRSYLRKIADYIAAVIITPLLWITVSGASSYVENMLGFDGSWYFSLLSHLASLGVIWMLFTLLYMIIPNTKVKFGSALMAGMVAGTVFLAFQWGYIYIQQWMSSYNAIYGSFAAIPLLLFWMQYAWAIFLFGGELSFAYQNIARFGEERESLHISYDIRRKVLLGVMLAIVRHFREHGGAVCSEQIRHRLDLPTRIVNDVLFQLVQSGQLIAVHTDEDDRQVCYAPAHDINTLTVYGVLEAVEHSGRNLFDVDSSRDMRRVDCEVEQLKSQARGSSDNVKLVDML